MNQEDIIRMMAGGMGGGQQISSADYLSHLPNETEIKTFVDKCLGEEGLSEHQLYQQVSFKLDKSPLLSHAEIVILPLVLKYISEGKL